jgi:hypothetical protein
MKTHPAASAGAAFNPTDAIGPFHGTILQYVGIYGLTENGMANLPCDNANRLVPNDFIEAIISGKTLSTVLVGPPSVIRR